MPGSGTVAARTTAAAAASAGSISGIPEEPGAPRILHVARDLPRRARLAAVAVLGHDAAAALGAGVVLAQPGGNAVAVEPVLARQLGDLGADGKGIHADAALRFAGAVEMRGSDVCFR